LWNETSRIAVVARAPVHVSDGGQRDGIYVSVPEVFCGVRLGEIDSLNAGYSDFQKEKVIGSKSS
jgi:hypothetical protein